MTINGSKQLPGTEGLSTSTPDPWEEKILESPVIERKAIPRVSNSVPARSSLDPVWGIAVTTAILLYLIAIGKIPEGDVRDILTHVTAIPAILLYGAVCVIAGAIVGVFLSLLNMVSAIAIRIAIWPVQFLLWILLGIRF